MDAKRIVLDVGFANIVAETSVYEAEFGSIGEMYVFLEDKDNGEFIQDIACVRKAYNPNTEKVIPDTVQCLVWRDPNNDSPTNEFEIKRNVEQVIPNEEI